MSGARSGRAQLAFPLIILLALAGTLIATGSRSPAVPVAAAKQGQDGSGSPDLLGPGRLTRIAVASTPRVARRVEKLRGLEFDQIPKPEVVTSAFLNRLGVKQARGETLGVGADNAFGRITGQLQPNEDLADAYTSTGDLAAAAYDPKTKRLYVVSDAAGTSRGLVEFLLSHELNHALEDQNFGIGGATGTNTAPQRRRGSASLRSASRNDDSALARIAQIEGSATSVMTDYASSYLNPLELITASQGIDDGSGSVPKAYLDQLTWAYLGGSEFIGTLRQLAGGWKLVDYSLDSRPPASTEQILHPVKYVHDELPAKVRIDPTELRARGWRPADRGVLGELPTSYLLRIGVDADVARRAAAGWNGDRYELWRRDQAPGECADPCRAHLAAVIRWRWDSPADGRQFAGAASGYVADGLGGEQVADDVWRVEDGFVALSSTGARTTLVFAPGEPAARAIAAAQ